MSGAIDNSSRSDTVHGTGRPSSARGRRVACASARTRAGFELRVEAGPNITERTSREADWPPEISCRSWDIYANGGSGERRLQFNSSGQVFVIGSQATGAPSAR